MANPFSRFDPSKVASPTAVAVIGLGRFGTALAQELMDSGTEVLGIDASEHIVQRLNGRLTHVVAGDTTSPELMEQLGIGDFDRVVVAIGTDITASILTTSQLLRLGIEHIWAKAVDEAHGQILEQLGVQHVIRPEADMGRRVAHMVRGSMEDFLEIEPGYAAVKVEVPQAIAAVPLRELSLQPKHGIAVAAVKREGTWINANAETRLEPGDTILVTGPTPRAEAFASHVAKARAAR